MEFCFKDRLVYRVNRGHPENTEKKERPVSMEKMEIPGIRGFLVRTLKRFEV